MTGLAQFRSGDVFAGRYVIDGVSLVPHQQAAVAVVECPKRSSETWVTEDGKDVFYIRASSATQALQGPQLTRYVRERWPA